MRADRSEAEVQSLLKGLRIIEAVNESPGMNVKLIAEGSGLPRTTAYRTLRTLEKNGFIYRDPATARYFPHRRVLKLSSGFDLAAQIIVAAREEFEAIGNQLGWPIYLATPSLETDSPRMQVRASTDFSNPLAVEKMLPGQAIPVLQCAAGLAWMASLPTAERSPLVDRALREPCERPDQVRWAPAALEEKLVRTRDCGYADFRRPGRYTNLVGLSVPVRIGGRALAALAVRFAETAVPMREAIDRFLPPLRSMSARLGAAAPPPA